MNNTLKKLLDLQNLDKEIIEIQWKKSEIIEKLRDEQVNYQKAADGHHQQIEDKKQQEVHKKKLELDIQQADEKIKHLEEQQSMVKKNKEYQTLSKEIKEAKEAKDKAELDLVGYIEEAEKKTTNLEAQAREVEELKKTFLVRADEVKAELQEIQNKFKKYRLLRKDIIKNIDPKYVALYSNLYEKRAPKIIVKANNSICGGCNISLPAQIVADILKMKDGEELVLCENCGRILYIAENEETEN